MRKLIMKMSMSLDCFVTDSMGLPIFASLASPLYLKLADVKTFPKGIVVHTYRRL